MRAFGRTWPASCSLVVGRSEPTPRAGASVPPERALAPPGRRAGGSLTAAAWVGVALAPLVCIWVFRAEILYHSADLASNALSLAAVGVLLVLLALRAILPRLLSARRVLLIYAAVAGTVGICTMGMVQFLITTLAAPFWFASPSNRWQEFLPLIPAWAAPRSPEVVRGFFLGRSSLYAPGVWRAWLTPALAWGAFLAALLAAQYCLAHLFYPRWARQERLAFPVVQVPLALVNAGASGRGALLAGAGIALAVQGLNTVHHAVPAVPGLRVLPVEFGSTLPEPWNAVGTLWYSFYPCIIGLSALVPTNILFSCVFFFLLTKGENVAAQVWGLRQVGPAGAGFPYGGEQAQGAVLALVLVIVWSARASLRASLRRPTDRAAWAVLALATAALCGFGLALGMRPVSVGLLFGLFLLFMLGCAWLRAAVGPVWNPGNDVAWWVRGVAAGGLTPADGVGLAYLRWFSFGDWRAHGLPTYADMMRLSEAAGIPRRRLAGVLAAGSLLGILASLWVALDVYYRYGAATALTDPWRTYQGRLAFENLRSQMDGVAPAPDLPQWEAAAFGLLAVLLLQGANNRLLWWPWHPAGFVMAQTGSLEWFWCPMAIAGVAKALILRAGGMRLYHRALPFFVGLILGDYALSVALALVGAALRLPMYKPFPI
ncbi:MAG: hypothetical protein IT208_17120 [Chthonomonadales bacterium]|nr:hypothetical protein [Chthonomonadales bacterium]